jgi:predicted RNA-binding Zn-ribbon protein involved in translation (DUF1610 family)
MTNSPIVMTCPIVACGRTMTNKANQPLSFRCPRCGTSIVIPTQEEAAEYTEAYQAEARRLMTLFPTLREAFTDWIVNNAYYDGHAYRLKSDRRRPASWSKLVKKFYPDTRDFHEAAHVLDAELETETA